MSIFIIIIVFVVILSLLILVHELGHFLTARKFGIAVEEFGMGLPPRLFGVKKKGTIFSLNWIPLGGFVRIKGEQGEHPKDHDSFMNHPIWQRGIVLSAGVIMNVVFAMVLLSFGFMVGAPQILDDRDLPGSASVRDQQIQIAQVIPGMPADKVDIKLGDKLLNIDNQPAVSIEQVQNYISKRPNQIITLAVERDEEVLINTLQPTTQDEKGVIGVELITTGVVSYPVYQAVWFGVTNTFWLLKEIILAFGEIIADLFTGEKIGIDVSGPVGIAIITAEVTKLGIIYLIQFAALLSINLAIINFIPFPALDGGRFLFLIIEKVKGRAINQQIEAWLHNIGFALLMLLIIVITYRDINRYQGQFIKLWDRVTSFL